jgi:formylglycine-generating enzyme required for sulfatase activity
MKSTRLPLLLKTLGLLVVAIIPASAQTPPVLAGELYLGVSITGTVGTVYAIQSTTDITQSTGWTCLAFVQLQATNCLWTDTTSAATGRRFYRAVATAPTNLVFIPPGIFRMGSSTNEVVRNREAEPQTTVTLTKGFFIGKYEVTQGEYQGATGVNPSYFNGVRSGTDYGTDLNRPVDNVSWVDATNYCAKRTELESVAGLIPPGSKYRLPTEAEWEYGCRALTSTQLHFGDDSGGTNLSNYAWYDANGAQTTHPVGQKLPNAWGLYDVLGNVYELCQDWYGPYPGGSVTNPQGPASALAPSYGRALRGSGFATFAWAVGSAWRSNINPTLGASDNGFRVVLAPSQ